MAEAPTICADSMAPEGASRIAAVIGHGETIALGHELPLLWHWAYFASAFPVRDVGPDGHPRRDDAWVDSHPRRLAGGGSVRWLAPLYVGVPAERHSTLRSAVARSGRSGQLIVCDWQHTYFQRGCKVLEEVQTVIYQAALGGDRRGDPDRGDVPPLRADAEGRNLAIDAEASWKLARRLTFDPVTLFRFSAATWNAHRIHYDRDYAAVEGHAGLVVHGPLLAALLAQDAEEAVGRPEALEYRARATVLDTDAINVIVQPAGDRRCQVEARKSDGTVAMTLTVSGLSAT